MTWRQRTGVVVGGISLGLIMWDFMVVSIAGSRATISNFLLTTSYHHPAIPLFMGGLMTHLFWPGRSWGPAWVRTTIAGLILLGAIVVGFAVPIVISPLWPFVAGLALGRLLVPQPKPKITAES